MSLSQFIYSQSKTSKSLQDRLWFFEGQDFNLPYEIGLEWVALSRLDQFNVKNDPFCFINHDVSKSQHQNIDFQMDFLVWIKLWYYEKLWSASYLGSKYWSETKKISIDEKYFLLPLCPLCSGRGPLPWILNVFWQKHGQKKLVPCIYSYLKCVLITMALKG